MDFLRFTFESGPHFAGIAFLFIVACCTLAHIAEQFRR